MSKMNKEKIFVISGPSGSGKTTLCEQLFTNKKIKKNLVKIVSVTTRARRCGEKNFQDYLFVSRKMFLYKKKAGHFLESQKVFDNYYGTPKKDVNRTLKAGKNVLLCIDVKGAREVCRKITGVVKIFIKTPDVFVLKQRLKRRSSEGKQSMNLRLKMARKELEASKKYKYIIINDDIKKASLQLKEIVFSEIPSIL